MRNQARLHRLHWAAHRAHQTYLENLTDEERLEYVRNMMAGQSRDQVAERMRQNEKFTEPIIANILDHVFAPYPDCDRLPGKPR